MTLESGNVYYMYLDDWCVVIIVMVHIQHGSGGCKYCTCTGICCSTCLYCKQGILMQ